MTCLHRSLTFSLKGCSSCSNTQIKIFSCSIHGRCAIRSPSSLIKSCSTCKERKEK